MKARMPLYFKMLLWLLLNVALLIGMYAALPGQGGLGWQTLLSEPVRDRLFRIGENVGTTLSQKPTTEWPAALAQYEAQYGVKFECCKNVGPPPGFSPHDGSMAPNFEHNGDKPPPPPDEDGGPHGPMPPMGDGPHGPPPGAMKPSEHIWLRHDAFGSYVLNVPVKIRDSGKSARPAEMTIRSNSLWSLLSFLGIQNWLAFPALALLLSLLLWWPLMWHITRSVSQITRATQRIAKGRFDVRIAVASGDELGTLAESVNHMAVQLQNHVDAQKRFMADVAHEVTSPLARMQIGLGILEAKVSSDAHKTLDDLHDDAQQMSELLNELLMFSRDDAEEQKAPLVQVDINDLLRGVVRREDPTGRVALQLDTPLAVIAHPMMLTRALSNLVRNALRYAGDHGTIEITVQRVGEQTEIAVRDDGPGVPADALARLGQPFFRLELSRSRESGGFGLGLAIVRHCLSACEGRVEFGNRSSGGFEARIFLRSEP